MVSLLEIWYPLFLFGGPVRDSQSVYFTIFRFWAGAFFVEAMAIFDSILY